ILAAGTIESLVSGLEKLLGPVRDEFLEAREADTTLIPLAVLRREGHRAEQLPLHEREIRGRTHVEPLERAGGHLRACGELVARPARDHVDRAADRIAAEQRALRTLQDLDTLDVEHIDVRADAAREIDIVDVNPDAGLEVERE